MSSTLPAPPGGRSVAPASGAVATALRWTAMRHQESLQSFLAECTALKEKVRELERDKGDRESLDLLGREEVEAMMRGVREEMGKVVRQLSDDLDAKALSNAKLLGDLEVKAAKVVELEMLLADSKREHSADADIINGEAIIRPLHSRVTVNVNVLLFLLPLLLMVVFEGNNK